MPSRNPAQRLADIIHDVDAIQGFTAELDFPAFRADRKTVYAVMRALEIISEASRSLPDELHRRHPEIDWAAVAAGGNVYRHEYEAVDDFDLAHGPTRCGGPTKSGRGADASLAGRPAAKRPAAHGLALISLSAVSARN
jgi:uncharacterized protein with HEPN domain